jgi:hypothetical protein
LPKLPPSRRPQHQSDLCRSGQAAGLTPARQPPFHPATRSPNSAAPRADQGFEGHSASLHYGQIASVAPKHPSLHSRHATDCRTSGIICDTCLTAINVLYHKLHTADSLIKFASWLCEDDAAAAKKLIASIEADHSLLIVKAARVECNRLLQALNDLDSAVAGTAPHRPKPFRPHRTSALLVGHQNPPPGHRLHPDDIEGDGGDRSGVKRLTLGAGAVILLHKHDQNCSRLC